MKLITQPGDGVAALVDAMDHAQTSVEIAIFRFDEASIERALTDAVKRGVVVTALIAHVNGSSADSLRELEMRLLAAGVTVARTDTTLARYHAKYVIVDRRELFVLAFNFTRQDIERSRSFGITTKRRDLVQEAAKVFEADMRRQPYKAGSATLLVSPSNARKQLSVFLKNAKTDLAIYDPRLSDPAILRILAERLKAGVDVRVIGRASDRAPSDLKLRNLANMRLHTRTIIRDKSAVFVGSQSLRTLELDGRREMGIICRDRTIIASALATFEQDWTASEREPVKALQPIAKVAKKVARIISAELPPVHSVIEQVVKESEAETGDLKLVTEALDDTIRSAVKDAVRSAIQGIVAQEPDQDGGPKP